MISAESFLDRSRKTPDTVENASKICCPSLYIRGDKEVPAAYPAEACAACRRPREVRILPNCDHWYTGLENKVAIQIADWLEKHCRFS